MSFRHSGPVSKTPWYGPEEVRIKLPHRESTEPIIGYRGWQLTPSGKLKSLIMDHIWDGPICRSNGKPTSLKPDYKSGEEGVDGNPVHGVYAFRKWESAEHYAVVGRVELSGRVIVHSEGFRAEIATVNLLLLNSPMYKVINSDVSKSDDEIKAALEREYQCDVVTSLAEFKYLVTE